MSSSWNFVKLSAYVFQGDFLNAVAHQTVDPTFGSRLVGEVVFNRVHDNG
jgi:hypothetical protein